MVRSLPERDVLLLVEDDPGDRRLFAAALRRSDLDLETIVAGSLAEATDVLAGRRIDLVLLDLGLPDSVGLASLTALARADADVPVIVLTGHDDPTDLGREALRRGAQDFLVKGRTGGPELGRAIRFALERHRLQKAATNRLLERAALAQIEAASHTATTVESFLPAAAAAIRAAVDGAWVTVELEAPTFSAAVTSPDRPPASPGVAPVSITQDLHLDGSTDVGALEVSVACRVELTPDQRSFLRSTAAVAATTIERLTTRTALEERTRQLRAVHDVAQAIQQGADEPTVLRTIAAILGTAVRFPELARVVITAGDARVEVGRTSSPSITDIGAPVRVEGEVVGRVQVGYVAAQSWLPDERTMVNNVADQVATWRALTVADHDRRASKDRFEQLMRTAPVALLLVDPLGRVAFTNEAATALLGLQPGDPSPWPVDGDGDGPSGSPLAAARYAERGVRGVERPVSDASGRPITVAINATPVRDHADGFGGVVVALTDVTSEREHAAALELALEREQQASDELRRLDSAKDGFLRAVSHELRTPLSVILGYAETVRHHMGELSPAQAQEMLDRVMNNGERLRTMLEDLLDLGRLTSGSAVVPALAEVDLSDVVRRAAASSTAEHHTVVHDLQPVRAHLEAAKVERVVHNLLHNALRHTPDGTTIWIRTRLDEDADRAVLVVEDDGPGIPVELRERLFGAFVQGPQANTAANPGTGVGLSIVRQFALLHGGDATIDERPGGGTRFEVWFPLTPSGPGTTKQADAAG